MSELDQFTGSEQLHRFNNLFRRVLATDGVMYVAKNYGKDGGTAFWLPEAIASHLVTNRKFNDPNNPVYSLNFWKLEKRKNDWLLSCREDSNKKPVVQQKIEYSDFKIDEITIWAARNELGWTLLLPTEY
jgi:hypothetical protein